MKFMRIEVLCSQWRQQHCRFFLFHFATNETMTGEYLQWRGEQENKNAKMTLYRDF